MLKNTSTCILLAAVAIATACCKDDTLKGQDPAVVWVNRICGNDMIGDKGLGHPIYKNTVVFHSTPLPIKGEYQTIVYGLNSETGKEKWKLTNADFAPINNFQFGNVDYVYQYENIVVGCDHVRSDSPQSYCYAIDIEAGKVLWIKPLPMGYSEIGRGVLGLEKTAYIDAITNNRVDFLKIDILTGDLSVVNILNLAELPNDIKKSDNQIRTCMSSSTYKNANNENLFAISINSRDSINIGKLNMTLVVYNLTTNMRVYATPVISNDPIFNGFYGRICYHDGKILVGKDRNVYCFDAFTDKGDPLWSSPVSMNDGVGFGSGNDNVMQIFGYNNKLLAICIDHLNAFDINTGKVIYNVDGSGGTDAAIIDGILYQRWYSDLGMIDPNTGKLLKRVATPKDDQAFANSRPSGANGKIYLHSYTDAYCIKAWGK
jgi:outer membrane protein assembly factor BamB